MHFENGYVTGNGPYFVDEGNQDDGRTTFGVTIPAEAAFGIVSIEAHVLDSFPFVMVILTMRHLGMILILTPSQHKVTPQPLLSPLMMG